MPWSSIEQPLISSRVLLTYILTPELSSTVYLVNTFWLTHILHFLRSKPLRITIDTHDINAKTEQLYHHLQTILRPGHFPFLPPPTPTNLQLWHQAFIQMPHNNIATFLPRDSSRGGERIWHINCSGTKIRGGSHSINYKRSQSIGKIVGRFRIGENVKDIELDGLNVQDGSWGVTVDDGSQVLLRDMQIAYCDDDGIMVTGSSTTCTVVNCVVENNGACGITIDDNAVVNMVRNHIVENGSDAICASGNAAVNIDCTRSCMNATLSLKKSMYTAFSHDDCESRIYAVRAEGRNTIVRIRGTTKKNAGDYFISINNLHSPMRELRGGAISYSKKRQTKPSKGRLKRRKNNATSGGEGGGM